MILSPHIRRYARKRARACWHSSDQTGAAMTFYRQTSHLLRRAGEEVQPHNGWKHRPSHPCHSEFCREAMGRLRKAGPCSNSRLRAVPTSFRPASKPSRNSSASKASRPAFLRFRDSHLLAVGQRPDAGHDPARRNRRHSATRISRTPLSAVDHEAGLSNCPGQKPGTETANPLWPETACTPRRPLQPTDAETRQTNYHFLHEQRPAAMGASEVHQGRGRTVTANIANTPNDAVTKDSTGCSKEPDGAKRPASPSTLRHFLDEPRPSARC